MQDTGHILFDRYGCGDKRRKVLDNQIKSGKRGFKSASEEMWGSLRVPFDAAVQTLKRSLRVDQDFEAFYAYCSANEVPFSVISAGLKPVLKQVLDNFLGEKEVWLILSHSKSQANS
jgi:2-hydroxy-3-keto-5-methylthiopentenyl-1-phosphate phosphatase